MFDIADVSFTGVSDEEKQVYAGTMKQTGSYQGYKLRHYWVRHHLWSTLELPTSMQHVDNGVFDQLEHYNSEHSSSVRPSLLSTLPVNRDVTKRGHPEALRPFLPEVKEFAKFNHFNVLHPILR